MKGMRTKVTVLEESKALKTPLSVGEEYNVKIEEMSRQGMGVAKIDGFVILVNNTRPGDRVMIRITKVGSGFERPKSLVRI